MEETIKEIKTALLVAEKNNFKADKLASLRKDLLHGAWVTMYNEIQSKYQELEQAIK